MPLPRQRLAEMGLAVIPKPVTMTPGTGAFVVRASSDVSITPSTPETRRIVGVLARMLGTNWPPVPGSATRATTWR